MKTWVQAVALLALVSGGILVRAQQIRDPRPAPPVGNGLVSGVVVTDDPQPQPVRRAIVTLAGPELLGGRIVVTDQSGTFRFSDLPAGRLTLGATKAAYLPTNFGAKRPGGPGVSVALAEGQRLTNLKLVMSKGAVISGRIQDERGRPLAGAEVVALRQAWISGERRPVPSGSTATDEAGRYRIFGLQPGDYLIRASRVGGGTIRQLLPGEVDAALNPQRFQPMPSVSPVTLGYSAIYFPGTADVIQSAAIAVSVGDEVGNIDFIAALVPTSEIRGLVIAGQALKQAVNLHLTGPSIPSGRQGRVPSASVSERPFVFSGVPPGRYSLLAYVAAGPDGLVWWAAADLNVNGRNIDGVQLTLERSMTVSGRLEFEGAGPGQTPSGWHVGLAAALGANEAVVTSGRSPVAADGTFSIRGATAGHYWVDVATQTPANPSGRPWSVTSISRNGIEHFDVPLDLRSGGDVTGLVIKLWPERTELSGTLQSATGEPAPDFFVIAFARDRVRWTRPSARTIRAVRPGTDGRFRIADLRPGEYYLAAVTDAQDGEWNDPVFLDQLISGAAKFSLAPGERKIQDIRIAK